MVHATTSGVDKPSPAAFALQQRAHRKDIRLRYSRLRGIRSCLFIVATGVLFNAIDAEPEGTWKPDDKLLQALCKRLGYTDCGKGGTQCNLPQISLRPDSFVPKNAFHVGPLVLRNLTQEWLAPQAWERHALLEKYGDMEVKAGYSPEIAAKGTQASEHLMPLRSLVEKWDAGDKKLFLFDSDDADNNGHCQSLACILSPGTEDQEAEFEVAAALLSMDTLIFSLGPSGQGLPLHPHGASWQSLIHGRKLWIFFPPGKMGESNAKVGMSAKEVIKLSYAGELSGPKPYFCVQDPGETIVFPHQWTHATLNVGDAVAIGGQVRGEMLSFLLECIEPLIKEESKTYEQSFGICEDRWKAEKWKRKAKEGKRAGSKRAGSGEMEL